MIGRAHSRRARRAVAWAKRRFPAQSVGSIDVAVARGALRLKQSGTMPRYAGQ